MSIYNMGAVFNLSYYTITTIHCYGIQIQWPMMMSFLMMSFLMMSFLMMSFMMMSFMMIMMMSFFD